MKILAVSLDKETVRLARKRAGELGMSLSVFIVNVLRKELRRPDDYEAAYRAWRTAKPFPLYGPPQPYPKREELYDRPVFLKNWIDIQ